MGGGLGSQFGGAQGELELIQDRQPAAAGGEQAARIGGRLGPQRLAEPAAGASQRRTAPPALRGRAQMTIGLIPRPRSSATRPPSKWACVASAEPSASSWAAVPAGRAQQLG